MENPEICTTETGTPETGTYTVTEILLLAGQIAETWRLIRSSAPEGVRIIGMMDKQNILSIHVNPGLSQLADAVGGTITISRRDDDKYPYQASIETLGVSFFQLGETPADAVR